MFRHKTYVIMNESVQLPEKFNTLYVSNNKISGSKKNAHEKKKWTN